MASGALLQGLASVPPKVEAGRRGGLGRLRGDARRRLIEGLGERLKRIERAGARTDSDLIGGVRYLDVQGCAEKSPPAWTFGAREVDLALAPRGLDPGALHELKPAPPETAGAAAGLAATIGFAVALAVRRQAGEAAAGRGGAILWCCSDRQSCEIGLPHLAGLRDAGLAAHEVTIVSARRASDLLWALEEGMTSEGFALVLGLANDLDLTQARRLALAAERHRTPCLVLTHPRAPPAGATATRFRIAPAPSASQSTFVGEPGPARFRIARERARLSGSGALADPTAEIVVEWRHATKSFDLVSRLADRPFAAVEPRRRAG